MKISTQNEWKLMDAIETGGTQFELASAVLEEVLESYFDEPSHWKDLPYNASRILSLLTVVCSLISEGKTELFKVRDEFSSEEEANGQSD
jgi:hypothetical protein